MMSEMMSKIFFHHWQDEGELSVIDKLYVHSGYGHEPRIAQKKPKRIFVRYLGTVGKSRQRTKNCAGERCIMMQVALGKDAS